MPQDEHEDEHEDEAENEADDEPQDEPEDEPDEEEIDIASEAESILAQDPDVELLLDFTWTLNFEKR